jgi:hypothetical protein
MDLLMKKKMLEIMIIILAVIAAVIVFAIGILDDIEAEKEE